MTWLDPEKNIVEGFRREKTSSVSFMTEKYRLSITSIGMGSSITFGVEDKDVEVSSVESLPTVAKLHERGVASEHIATYLRIDRL